LEQITIRFLPWPFRPTLKGLNFNILRPWLLAGLQESLADVLKSSPQAAALLKLSDFYLWYFLTDRMGSVLNTEVFKGAAERHGLLRQMVGQAQSIEK